MLWKRTLPGWNPNSLSMIELSYPAHLLSTEITAIMAGLISDSDEAEDVFLVLSYTPKGRRRAYRRYKLDARMEYEAVRSLVSRGFIVRRGEDAGV